MDLAERKSVQSAGMWMRISAPLVLAAVVLPLIGRLYLAAFEAPSGAPPLMLALAAIVFEALPPLLLCVALFNVIAVLSEYEHARFTSRRASAAMKRAGAAATIALVLHVAAVPLALAALRGEPLWPALNPDVFDLTVMIFATSMLTIGAVLEAAARALQSENDQIV